MTALRIPSLSTEYVKVPITGPATLTSLPVQMAIVPDGQDPAGGDWKTAEWIGTDAAVLIGPATALPLTKGGTYGIWVKITSAPEIPVLGPYSLYVT
ncbi:hypothetical protein [Nonomuraea roseoviolacea]|uniref:Uncharacterized protein n=1 Tax=Nonomuraea roseoviolacea subsp. carminata TaxID=160689 RepID=A0ABT1K9D7_9ACTN|nr:hypothetical protein [Nonomuraea roseoviolacea]MCP2350633.1 hypothetical protein [Nonomuraea roseoviolacea subsp. carminata]